jgi:hypothetical protein
VALCDRGLRADRFAALLGDERDGRWLLAPTEPVVASTRRYRPGTLVLETEFSCGGGTVSVVDCMARRGGAADEPLSKSSCS